MVERQRLQVGAERGEHGVPQLAVVLRPHLERLLVHAPIKLRVAELADRPGVEHGRGVDDADPSVVQELRPDNIEAPPPPSHGVVQGRQQPLQSGPPEARHHDLDKAHGPRMEALVAHRAEVLVVRFLVQRRRKKLELQSRSKLEHPADRILAGEHVVVRQPDVIVIPPAAPSRQQVPQARLLRTGNHLARDAIQPRLWRDFLEGTQVKIPIPCPPLVDLGLGLIAPFFQKPGSRLYLLNRAVSERNATGTTALTAERRNQLLHENPDKHYVIHEPGGGPGDHQTIRYDGFFEYDASGPESVIRSIVAGLPQEPTAVVVTASVLKAENYGPVSRRSTPLQD